MVIPNTTERQFYGWGRIIYVDIDTVSAVVHRRTCRGYFAGSRIAGSYT